MRVVHACITGQAGRLVRQTLTRLINLDGSLQIIIVCILCRRRPIDTMGACVMAIAQVGEKLELRRTRTLALATLHSIVLLLYLYICMALAVSLSPLIGLAADCHSPRHTHTKSISQQ